MQNPEPEQHDNEIETNNDYHASPELSAHPYVMKNLTGIGKRLNRLDFAILIFTVYLFELLAHKLFGINPIIIAFTAAFDPDSMDRSANLGLWINLIGMLAVLSFAIQRLHDLGYSAWTATIFFIPALGIPVISLLAVPVSMIIGLILLFARGVAQPNKYGPPPAGHKKNKLLIFIAVLIVTFMLYSSHFQEAKPVIDPIIQNILNVQ